ncbi:hypothetical protein V8C35DRAFT_313895 [Trichoderma chlorosporum]
MCLCLFEDFLRLFLIVPFLVFSLVSFLISESEFMRKGIFVCFFCFCLEPLFLSSHLFPLLFFIFQFCFFFYFFFSRRVEVEKGLDLVVGVGSAMFFVCLWCGRSL